MFRFLATVLLMLVIPITTSSAVENTGPTDWSTTFRDDLEAARRIILESHPGPVDVLNPGFGDWLETGFEQQMALAESVDSADAYVYEKQGGNNYGSDTQIFLHGTPGFVRRGLLRFDTSKLPPEAVVTAATLQLYMESAFSISGSPTVTAYPMTEPWWESAVTHDTSDGTTPWNWVDNHDTARPGGSVSP